MPGCSTYFSAAIGTAVRRYRHKKWATVASHNPKNDLPKNALHFPNTKLRTKSDKPCAAVNFALRRQKIMNSVNSSCI